MSFHGRQMFSRSNAVLRLVSSSIVSPSIVLAWPTATWLKVGTLSQLRWFQPPKKPHPFRGNEVTPKSPQDMQSSNLAALQEAYGGLSADAVKLATDIVDGKVNPTEYLQAQIEAKSATPENVRVCLRAGLERIKKFPRKKRMHILQSEKQHLARTALNMLWQDQNLWTPLLVYDDNARLALCYFAVAENLEQLITRWLNLDLDDMSLDVHLRRWRGKLLQAMVTALFTHNIESSATKALEYFFRVLALQNDARDAKREVRAAANFSHVPPLARLSLKPASRTIAKELSHGGSYPATDPKLFDSFVRFYDSFKNLDTDTLHEFNMGAFAACHPTRPDPRRWLAFLRSHLTPMTSAADLAILDGQLSNASSILAMVATTAKLLRQQGHTSDAVWVEQQAARLRIPPPSNPHRRRPARQDNFEA